MCLVQFCQMEFSDRWQDKMTHHRLLLRLKKLRMCNECLYKARNIK